jgi:3-isopropylmalate/(R)-2-methylmalate dehydratase small subunit
MNEGELIQLVPKGVQLANGTLLPCQPIPDFLMDMVHAGGLMNVLKQRSQGTRHA